jgi:hypothetical protein
MPFFGLSTRNIERPCRQAEMAHRSSAPMYLVIRIPANNTSRCCRFEAAAHVAADSERAFYVIIITMEACHKAYFSQMLQVV